MNFHSISPLDTRYSEKIQPIAKVFSDVQLTHLRIYVMRSYLHFIASTLVDKEFTADLSSYLVSDLRAISMEEIHRKVCDIEKETNHDVKACEYYIRSLVPEKFWPYIHFGLTSNDVNSVAYALMLKDGLTVIQLKISEISKVIHRFGLTHPYAMLSHTHGQPATPTTFYYTMLVFMERLEKQLSNAPKTVSCKFGSATGGLNTFYLIDDSRNWERLLENFLLENFNLHRQRYTTQIDHYDNYSEIFDWLKRVNVILLDFATDIWQYISMGYIVQVPKEGEVGSSVMPHKVNPIDMENAEGNLHLSNALLEMFSRKLPNSRLQRDLSDSTVLRNIGVAFSHSYLAMQSILNGLRKYIASEENMHKDLDAHWEVLAEAVQTILRFEGVKDGYEIVKKLTRNNKTMGQKEYLEMVEELKPHISEAHFEKLRNLKPWTYLGYQ